MNEKLIIPGELPGLNEIIAMSKEHCVEIIIEEVGE